MKYLSLLILLAYASISFAQYTFKYEAEYTQLIELTPETLSSKSAERYTQLSKSNSRDDIPDDTSYYSKVYITSSMDTLTIMPKISVIVKNESEIGTIIK